MDEVIAKSIKATLAVVLTLGVLAGVAIGGYVIYQNATEDEPCDPQAILAAWIEEEAADPDDVDVPNDSFDRVEGLDDKTLAFNVYSKLSAKQQEAMVDAACAEGD